MYLNIATFCFNEGQFIGFLFMLVFGINFLNFKRKPAFSLDLIIKLLSEREDGENIYILDNSFNYLYFNQYHYQSMKDTFGFSPKVGLNILNMLPEKYSQRYTSIYKNAVESKRYTHLEKVGVRYLKFSFYKHPVSSNENIIVVSVKDETDGTLMQQELEKYREELEDIVEERSRKIINQRNFFQQLIDEDPNYLFVRNSSGKYIMANEASAASFGVSVNETIGKSVIELHSNKSEALSFVSEDQEILLTGKEHNSIVRHDGRDGSTRWAFLKKKRIEIEGEYFILGILTDITSLKEVQEALEKKNDELKNTLEELKEMQIKLVSSEKMASVGQLTAGFAHEINNPINYVGGNIAPLRRDIDELYRWVKKFMSADHEESIELNDTMIEIDQLMSGIEEGASRIKKLIKDLKNLASSQSDEPIICDINQDLSATIRLINSGLSDQVVIKEDYGIIQPILAVSREMQQVYLNIFDYCLQQIKFNGEIHFETYIENEINHITISILGIQLPHHEIVELFDPFSRTDRDATKLGLGLAISFRIITKLNGDLFINEQFTSGTQFVVKIPAMKS